jgi:hypothetical protein
MKFSNMASYMPTILLALAILTLAIIYNRYQWHKKYRLPPGPKGLLYFGNMFQMPPYHQGPWAKDLAEKFGEMYGLYFPCPFPVFSLSFHGHLLLLLY